MWHYTGGIHNLGPDLARPRSGSSPACRHCGSTRTASASSRRTPRLTPTDDEGDPRHRLRLLWFILTHSIVEKVRRGPSRTPTSPKGPGRDPRAAWPRCAQAHPGVPRHGVDFVTALNLADLVAKMNEISCGPKLDPLTRVERVVSHATARLDNKFQGRPADGDDQCLASTQGDKVVRVPSRTS